MAQGAGQHENRQGRLVALVIAGAMLLWIVVQWLGPKLGLAGRFAILIDLAVLAAFFLGDGGVFAHVAAPPETREMRRVC